MDVPSRFAAGVLFARVSIAAQQRRARLKAYVVKAIDGEAQYRPAAEPARER